MSRSRKPDSSPSYNRRQTLRDSDAGNLVTVTSASSYPLEKHFQIIERLLRRFQQALEERRMDETYVYGIRFATFCLEQLPNHPQYNQKRFQKAKIRNARQVDRVLKTMEIITQRMDAEELVKQKKEEQLKKEQIQSEENERKERLAKEEEENQQRRLELERQKSKKMQQEQIKHSAYAKLQTMKEEQKKVEQSAYAKLQTMQEKQIKPHPNPSQMTTKKVPPTTNVVESVTPLKKKEDHTLHISNKPLSMRKVDEQLKPDTTIVLDSSKPKTEESKPSTPKKRQPMTKEEKTIATLEDTIEKQEARLVSIEEVSIPNLLEEAMSHLDKKSKNYNRKAALNCLARKKKLEGIQDTIKNAIFNMETQIFMLENAMGDRQVKDALESAAQAMEGIQSAVGGMDATTLQAELEGLSGQPVVEAATMIDVDMEFDEHELEQELEQWTSPSSSLPENNKSSSSNVGISVESNDADDEISILSLPKVSAQKRTISSSSVSKKKKSSPRRLIRAVLG
mmetsp:Transcript_21214/g.27919  ORF Transcript_21214/g.27919 Transcript_21214/m.27919 type:complete len:510 (+) Transcript_21214:51-1580(+)